jgi:adenylate cyclase
VSDDAGAELFKSVLMPASGERTVSAAQIEAAGGPPVEKLMRMMEAYGLPQPDPDAPAFSPQEAHMFHRVEELEDIWPFELGLQSGRVYGRLLARIAQTELQLFRVFVEPRLRAEAPDRESGLRAVRDAFAELLPLGEQMILGVHRRWLEHELAQFAIAEAETDLGADALPGTVVVAFLFCDLKDFTAYADTEGDEAAVAAIDTFAATVVRERGTEFRFTKALGDGFMLSYGDAEPAVAAGARIIDAMRSDDLPGVHASVHYGKAIAREGDYFGSSVNLAARLLNAAERDELVATRQTVDACPPERNWEPRGNRRVRGFAEPVELYRLAA